MAGAARVSAAGPAEQHPCWNGGMAGGSSCERGRTSWGAPLQEPPHGRMGALKPVGEVTAHRDTTSATTTTSLCMPSGDEGEVE